MASIESQHHRIVHMIRDETAVKLSAVSFTRFSQRIRPIYLLKFMVQRLAPSSPLTFSTKAKLPTATRRQRRAAFFSHSACQLDWAATNGTDHTIHNATQIAVHAAKFTKPRLREIMFS
jgi:hypothetical protein